MTVKIFLFIGLLAFSHSGFAQDVIVLQTGDEIKAIVEEIGLETIKYKKYTNLDGPTYSVLKSDVFMVKYQSGDKDVFTPNGEILHITDNSRTVEEPRIAEKSQSAGNFQNEKKIRSTENTQAQQSEKREAESPVKNDQRAKDTHAFVADANLSKALSSGWEGDTLTAVFFISGTRANYAKGNWKLSVKPPFPHNISGLDDGYIQTALGLMLLPMEPAAGMSWLLKASMKDQIDAINSLALNYATNSSVTNTVEAERWYRKALALGDKEAESKLNDLLADRPVKNIMTIKNSYNLSYSMITKEHEEKAVKVKMNVAVPISPVTLKVNNISYIIEKYEIKKDDQNKTIVTAIGKGFNEMAFSNNELIFPFWCNFISNGKEYRPVNGNSKEGSIIYIYDTSVVPETLIFYPGNDESKRIEVRCK